jgi:hypothetical protein
MRGVSKPTREVTVQDIQFVMITMGVSYILIT